MFKWSQAVMGNKAGAQAKGEEAIEHRDEASRGGMRLIMFFVARLRQLMSAHVNSR